MSPPRSRRRFLQVSGITFSATLLGGCSRYVNQPSGIELGDVAVRNGYSNRHTVRVEIERDGELVHEGTYEVAGGSVELAQATWSRDPAVYTLSYVIVGPDEKPDIHTERITGADDQSDGQACAVAAITFGTWSEGSPYVTVGSPVALSGDCSPE